ncbi:zinc finger protein 436-like isoform X2 [Puntigrus tetrazona]|uniref:zinc finger protein 436-like isoform X2 n=1 Tax=Puntigrus tetrazona TaxID=1606681 RepID=UPI001C89DA25|nr:zinc finger protein 436-like isoform X2 [Puntigrus tetrazona]
MSCEASVQKQVLLIMDSLVSSLVTEICQLDIFQSKRQNGNPETDIKMNLTAAIRRITNSTAEHICRILHTASNGPRKDLIRSDQVNHTGEQRSSGSGRPLNAYIRDEEHVQGGDRRDLTSGVVSGIQERLTCNLLQPVEEEPEFRFEEVFVHEEEQVDESIEPGVDESESVEHQRDEWTTEPNTKDELNDASLHLNTLDPPDIIKTESIEPSADESESVERREEQWTTEPNISVQLNMLDPPDILETGMDDPADIAETADSVELSADESESVERPREEPNTEDRSNGISVQMDPPDVIETRSAAPTDTTEEAQPNASGEQNVCTICAKAFSHLNNLRRHEQKLHRGETPHACQECGERFGSRRLLQTHRRDHKVEKPHKCALCDKVFRLPNHLRNHMTSHGDRRPFSCGACGKSFALTSVLRAHERTHAGEKNFACSQCGSRFLTKSYLDYHRRVHTGEKPHLCKHCGKSFAQKGNLKAHERLHTGEQPFRCEECGKTFVHANTFKSHKQLHTGVRAFCCELCGKGFRRGTHLKTHLLTHSGDKPFGCDVCGKAFALKGSLKTHRLTHTGQKSHACDVCSKQFTQASSLAKHRRVHTGEKPHRCGNCGKRFSQSSHLSYHSKVCQSGAKSSANSDVEEK